MRRSPLRNSLRIAPVGVGVMVGVDVGVGVLVGVGVIVGVGVVVGVGGTGVGVGVGVDVGVGVGVLVAVAVGVGVWVGVAVGVGVLVAVGGTGVGVAVGCATARGVGSGEDCPQATASERTTAAKKATVQTNGGRRDDMGKFFMRDIVFGTGGRNQAPSLGHIARASGI